MFDITHDVTICAPLATVYAGLSTPAGLDAWWTETCKGDPARGGEFELGFGDHCLWRASVTELEQNRLFVLKMTDAASDWINTIVRFELEPEEDATVLHFSHQGWADQSPHYRRSSYCWAMYLRLLRLFCERADVTPYGARAVA